MSSKPAHEDDELLSIRAAADFVGVHPETLRRWADARRVPVSRTVTNHRRFLVADLRKLIRPEAETDAEPTERPGGRQPARGAA